jgi:hypothetical protein
MRNFEIKAINQQQKVEKIKNINNTSNTQSMTNEEARQLTGKVAMTRALFETKENINSCLTNTNSQQTNKFSVQMNRAKQNLSNYNLSDNNTKFQSQKQSFSATNLSSILKQPSNDYKENKYMPKLHSNNKQFEQPSSHLTSISIKRTAVSDSEMSFNNRDNSQNEYKFQNLNSNTFKPIIRKLKKFSINVGNEDEEEVIKSEDRIEQEQYLTSQPGASCNDIVLPSTSVKQVKACFENLASSFGTRVVNNNRFKQLPVISLNNKPNLNNGSDDNGSVSSVSSFSSSNSAHVQQQNNPNLFNSKFEALKIAAGSSLSSSASSASSSSASPIIVNSHEIPTMKFDLPRSYIKHVAPLPSATLYSNTSSSCETTPRSNQEVKNGKISINEPQKNVNIRNPENIIKNESSAFYDRYRHVSNSNQYQINESSKFIQQPPAESKFQQQNYIQSPRFNFLQKQIDNTHQINSTTADRHKLTSVDENKEEKVNFRHKTQSVNNHQIHNQNCISLAPTTQLKNVVDNSKGRNRSQSLIDQRQVQFSKNEHSTPPVPVKK